MEFTYTAALSSGSGVAIDKLEAGSQRIIPDAISYLRHLGMTIPEGGSGGTVRALFSGISSPDEAAAVIRTTNLFLEDEPGWLIRVWRPNLCSMVALPISPA